MVFGRMPIFRPKIENFTLAKCYLFSILYTPAKFQASRFNEVFCTVYFLRLEAENTAVT